MVKDGLAAPTSPLVRTQNAVRVTIGGLNAKVQFAGLTPAFVGLYQVNVLVPSGLQTGNAPVVVSVAGQSSSRVALSIQ